MAETTREDMDLPKKRHRSPSYPTIGLREAVERLGKFYKVDGKAGAPPEPAIKHMGYSTAHGAAFSALAALKKFGLVAESNGRIVPTQRAIEILNLQESDPRRLQAIRDAAIAPEIHRQLIRENPNGLPGDDSLESELVAYKDFNPNAVKGFVKDFKDTLDFAALSDLSVLAAEVGDQEEPDMATEETVLQPSAPQPRIPLRPLTNTPKALPIENQTPISTAQAHSAARAMHSGAAAETRQDIFSLTEGQVTIEWPTSLSPESYEDVADWLEIVKRKIGRSVVSEIKVSPGEKIATNG